MSVMLLDAPLLLFLSHTVSIIDRPQCRSEMWNVWSIGSGGSSLCNWRLCWVSQHLVCSPLLGFSSHVLALKVVISFLPVRDLHDPDEPIFSVQGHKSIINCIDGCGGMNVGYGAPEIVTGSRDGEPAFRLRPQGYKRGD